ncbi:MAG: MEDS domain-containing protein [Nocardiopsaceae bacterium]|nr:MEDS domain-containing protein [Nocardiopsaceae bacterium]
MHDHMGCVFEGANEFAALAGPYLTEGAALGERLVYVAQDPRPRDVAQLGTVVDPGQLQISTVAETYGTSGNVDPLRQLDHFMSELDAAKAAGYTGLRVAADNTSLVGDDKAMKAWIEWEIIADHTVAGKEITGLCAFDKGKVGGEQLRQLASVHPLSSASGPVPQYRIFSDGEALRIEGRVDPYAITQLWRALETLPVRADVVVDLATARLMGPGVLAGLTQLCDCGIGLTIRGDRSAIEELKDSVSEPSERLTLEEAG